MSPLNPETDEFDLDLGYIRNIVTNATAVIDQLDGYKGPADVRRGRWKDNQADLAVISRDLLRLTEMFRLAATEVQTYYWEFKGYPDPRELPDKS